MKMNIDEVELNQTINSSDIIQDTELKGNENMWLVGKAYTFVDDDEVMHMVKTWATGFKPQNYDYEEYVESKAPLFLALFAAICATISVFLLLRGFEFI